MRAEAAAWAPSSAAKTAVAIGIILYAGCLPLGNLCVNGSCSAWPGWSIVLAGWIEQSYDAPANFGWWANPVLWLSWLLFWLGKRGLSAALAMVALGLSIVPLAYPEVIFDESGMVRPIDGYHAGYWLWMAACGASLVGGLYDWLVNPQLRDSQSPG